MHFFAQIEKENNNQYIARCKNTEDGEREKSHVSSVQ